MQLTKVMRGHSRLLTVPEVGCSAGLMGRDLSDSRADSPGCEGATARRCPHHAVAALNDITGAPVDWVGSEGLNEWKRKALELSEERANSAMGSAL